MTFNAMRKLLQKIKPFFFKDEVYGKLCKPNLNMTSIFIFIVIVFVFVLSFVLSDEDTIQRSVEKIYEEPQKQDSSVNVKSQTSSQSFASVLPPQPEQNEYSAEHKDSLIIENEELSKMNILFPGTLIPAVTITKIVSSSSELPVLASITEDVLHPITQTLIMEKGSKIIGSAKYDSEARRIQIYFKTLITPLQKKYEIHGLALDRLDHSSVGLSGKYHSEKLQKMAGSVLSAFIGGVAKKLKGDSSPFGLSAHSIKDVILDEAGDFALSEARKRAQKLENTQGFVEVSNGTPIYVFLMNDFSLSE